MFIYVVEGSGDLLKVGRAIDPARRLGALRTGSGTPLSICAQIAVEPHEGALVERFAHWLLRADRSHGEWFRVSKTRASDAIQAAVEAVRRGEKPGPKVSRVGRKNEFPERITLPLAAGKSAEIDALLEKDEPRVAFIREAIEALIRKRSRQK